MRTVSEQAAYWRIDVPSDFVVEFDSVTFGRYHEYVNVWQWDVVRRALDESWGWVAQWVQVGYAEPPEWLTLQALVEMLAEKKTR